MAYARFGDDSDVYVYPLAGTEHAFECCCCRLTRVDDQLLEDARALLAHLAAHEAAGHRVPPRCYQRLRSEHPSAWALA